MNLSVIVWLGREPCRQNEVLSLIFGEHIMNYSAKDLHLSWLFRQHLIGTVVIGITLGHVDPLLPRVVGAHVMVFVP